jgi:hypothetical protein
MKATDRSLRPWRHTAAVVLIGTLAAAGVSAVTAGGPAVARGLSASAHKSGHHSYNFDAPSSGAAVGADLFVTNEGNNSVTEVRTSNGSLAARISGKRFDFDAPTAIVAVGADLFVANGANNSITEFKASGHKYVRTINAAGDGFSDPIALAPSGQDLFVLNGSGTVTEIATATGALVGIASGPGYGFDGSTGLAVANGDVFVANSMANTVTVLNAGSRAFVASLSGGSFGFSTPTGITYDGTDMWVTNEGSSSVTEFSPTTLNELNVLDSSNLPQAGPIASGNGYVFAVSPWGSSPMVTQITTAPATVNWMMCNTNGPYLFNNPQALVVAGTNLWVVNEGGNSLTEMDTSTGNLIKTFFNS